MGDRRDAYRVLVGRSRERDNLEDPGVDGENIKMDLHEVGWGGMDWIDLAGDRESWRGLVNAVMNFRVPKKCGEFLD